MRVGDLSLVVWTSQPSTLLGAETGCCPAAPPGGQGMIIFGVNIFIQEGDSIAYKIIHWVCLLCEKHSSII